MCYTSRAVTAHPTGPPLKPLSLLLSSQIAGAQDGSHCLEKIRIPAWMEERKNKAQRKGKELGSNLRGSRGLAATRALGTTANGPQGRREEGQPAGSGSLEREDSGLMCPQECPGGYTTEKRASYSQALVN